MHSTTSGPLAGQMRMAGAKITWEAASFTWLVPEPEGLEGSAGTVTWSTYTWQVRVTWLLTAEQPALTGCVSRESALSRRPRKKLRGSFGLTPEVTGVYRQSLVLHSVVTGKSPRPAHIQGEGIGLVLLMEG